MKKSQLLLQIFNYKGGLIEDKIYGYKYIALSLLLFFIPFFSSNSQIITGTIVNIILIYIAFNYRRFKLIPAILLPSLATIIKGGLFQSFNIFLLPVIPVIWIGNILLILTIRYLSIKKLSLLKTLTIGALIKPIVMLILVLLINSIINLPSIIINSMGLMQFITLGLASLIYYFLSIINIKKLGGDKNI